MDVDTCQVQYDQRAYALAREYLLSLEGITPDRLDKHLSPAVTDNRPETLAGIYERLLGSASGATMSPVVIGGAIGGLHALGALLCDFVPPAVVGKYGDDWERVFTDIKTQLKPRGKVRETSQSLWPKFSKTITSGAAFLAQFEAAVDFYGWVDSFDHDVESRIALVKEFSSKVFGMGFALTCDFIKELGYLGYSKPDVHLKVIFSGLGLCAVESDCEVFRAIARVAQNVGVTPYDVDRVFWLIGSGDFYLDGVRVGQHREEFINYARVELNGLPGQPD